MIGTEDHRCRDLSARRTFQQTLGGIVQVLGVLGLEDERERGGFNSLDIRLAREKPCSPHQDGSGIDWIFANVITPLLKAEEKCKNRVNSG